MSHIAVSYKRSDVSESLTASIKVIISQNGRSKHLYIKRRGLLVNIYLLYIRKVLLSNLGPKTDYPDYAGGIVI
jgi:hypothetical protein